jgi:hypothetical protein
MLPRTLKRLAALSLVVLALPLAGRLGAQTVDLERDRVQMAELHGLWRFHTGDDMRWADPGFDDSSWKLLRPDQPWSDQGYKGYAGTAWYRFQVIVPANHPALALYVPRIDTSYQVFAAGRLIGQWGGLPPHEEVVYGFRAGQIIPIPADLEPHGGPLTFALRVWLWPSFVTSGGGPHGTARIGDPGLLNEWRTVQYKDAFWSVSAENVLLLGYLLAGFAGLGLYLMRPREREYLWFAATEFIGAAWCGFDNYPAFYPSRYHTYFAFVALLFAVQAICVPNFYVSLLRVRRGLLYWMAMASLLGCALVFIPGDLGWIGLEKWVGLVTLFWIPFGVCALLLIYLAARRGNLDARLLLVPVGLSYGANIASFILSDLFTFGYTGARTYQRILNQLVSWPFPVSVQNIADFLMQISILAILVLRFARTRRDEERHASELEAARVVQQVLIPEATPFIPGFQIECIYKPAGQVGGDFFQIVPVSGGGALVAIGDVSGKGMPAAMMVSLLVGTLRTAAETVASPAAILAAMNRRALAHSTGGFTTCLVLRIDRDGTVTVANAGHLTPYCNGAELEVESGFPLGLSAQSHFLETTFTLHAGEQLTLLTDGVVEARGKGGELFGFARTQVLSCERAEQIAQTAQAFGQDDDITVLTLAVAP